MGVCAEYRFLWKEDMMQGGRIGKGKFPGCACEKPCRRHVRKVQVSAYAETLLPLPGPGVSPASVSEYPKRIF